MLIRPLFEGPLDIVGDVHGELEPLRALLTRLGYDLEGRHPPGRRLVFVGDLCDRGPDSPGVIRVVRSFVERGLAQLVLGNHELNLLRAEHKHGNHWFYGDRNPEREREFGPCVYCGSAERDSIVGFLATLPIALERADLRVVHAAWHDESIETCRRFKGIVSTYEHFDKAFSSSYDGGRLHAAYEEELRRSEHLIKNPAATPPLLEAIGAYDARYQMSNPLRVVTSGVERMGTRPFFAGGKWRFVDRVRWWRAYRASVPVVFGHYWRFWRAAERAELIKGEPNLFEGDAPDAWQRNDEGREVALCIDYSVGSRFKERLRGKGSGFAGRLAALRWPERELVFDG